MDNRFKLGNTVWIVERDENGIPYDVVGVELIAIAPKHLICAALPYGVESYEEIMEYYADDTAENEGTELYVFSMDDCYSSEQNAREAMNEELEESEVDE